MMPVEGPAERAAAAQPGKGTRHGKAVIAAGLALLLSLHGAAADEALWGQLAAGGKVVVMRHGPVERGPGGGDPRRRDPTCKAERNLSSEGRRAAERLGRRFRERRIAVAKVLHSPYCRTTDTARIAFGEARPAPFLALRESLEPEQAARQDETLARVIGAHAGDGNLVLVTHEPNIAAVSFELAGYLDLVVLEPRGEGGFEELGVIRFAGSE